MKVVFTKIIICSLLFCFVGITSAKDIQVVANLEDLEDIVNFTWVSNSVNRLMPPAKDCVYNNSLGVIAYTADFDTNFIASLTPVVLYNGSNEFLMYPVEVIETNNTSGRIRNYYSAISTNPAILHSNEVSIVNYPESWIEDIYGKPPVYLSGSAIQDWYDECDPMRQHVLCDLLSSNSVPDYLIMLTNSIGCYTEGTNTNSVLDLYSNCIAVVQCDVQAENAELYLHAPGDISMLDVYRSTNLLEQYSWEFAATLEHTLDPLRYLTDFDTSYYYSLGNGELDSDGDGLLDARELKLFGTDPDSADSDGDGLSDGDEMLFYRLNPLNSDTDGDGLSDGYECGFLMIEAWGDNFYGQCNVPDDLTNIVAMAAGYGHSLALCSDGTVTAWGRNGSGQCTVPTELNNVTDIDAHYWHSIALKADGTVIAWGYNYWGQCNVPSGLTNVIDVATGHYHGIALKDNGTVVVWGSNYQGQLNIPVGLGDVIAIDAGFGYNLALHSNGTVTTWGKDDGQTAVMSGLSNVVAIAAGGYHCLALRSDGTVVAAGWDYNGQSTVPEGLSNVVSIVAGYSHSMALKSDGTIVAWGANGDGQISVPYGLENVIAMTGGMYHSMALINPGLNPCAFDTDGDGLGDGWEMQYELDPFDSTGENGADGDSDNDNLTNLEEQQAGTDPRNSDTDGDLLSDGWEVQYGLDPLDSSQVNGSDGDPDNDDLTNLEEQAAGTDPNDSDTDDDTLGDLWEVLYGIDPCDSTGDNGIYGDPDKDSLTNLEEFQLGTYPNNWDTDGDFLSDSWEVQYGLNPLVFNNVETEDIDGDGLFLFDEYRYVTNPNNPDTDGDGVSDGDEVPHSRGSNPNDADDYGNPSNCVTMSIAVGDPSGSNSERWRFDIFNENKETVHHVDDGFGTPGTNEYSLCKGKNYTYRIEWVDHNEDYLDYDWMALINEMEEAGVFEGLYNTGGFIVEDPEDLLTTLYNGSDINEAEDLEGKIIVPLAKISSDYDYSGVVGDSGDANTNGEYNVTGLVVPISTNILGMIELDILPDDMDGVDIALAVEKTGDGDIKVWTTSTRQESSLLLYTLNSEMMEQEWSLNDSFQADDIPDTLYVEGVDDSSEAGDVSLILKVKYDDDLVIATTQKITVVQLDLDVDTDRDGAVEVDGDEDGEDDWTTEKGAIYNVNFDRDGTNMYGSLPAPDAIHFDDGGNPCNENYVIDNDEDELDIAPMIIREIRTELPTGWKVYLKAAELEDVYNIHVYKKIEADEENSAIWGTRTIIEDCPPYDQDIEITQWVDQFGSDFQGDILNNTTFGIEGLSFRYEGSDVLPTKHFDGYIDLTLELRCGDTVIDSDSIRMKVAPWIMLSREQASEEIWAADYGEKNDEMLYTPEQGYYALDDSEQLHTVANQNNQWFQDHIEIGFTQRPGGPKTHVVFRLPYYREGCIQPTWPLSNLLTNNVGSFQLGISLGTLSYDSDYGGNLEVLSPTDDFPLGIIELGNCNFSALLKQFLESQEVQGARFDLPVDWLWVGHIDEVTSFLPNGEVVLADTITAWNIMENLPDYSLFFAKGAAPVGGTIPSNSVEVMPSTPRIVKIFTGIDHTAVDEPDWKYIRIYDDSVSASGAQGSVGLIWEKHDGYVIATNVYYTGSKIMDGSSISNTYFTDDYDSLCTSYQVLQSWGTNGNSYPLTGDKFVLCEESLSWAKAPAIVTVSEVLGDNTFANLNTNLIQYQLHTIETNILNLSAEYSTTKVPAMFFGELDENNSPNKCFAFVPGATNLQPINSKLYVPRQFGPFNSSGIDAFASAVEEVLESSVRFVDCWRWYHTSEGEIHCGSNVKREKLNINWWENLL